jgi:ligand-binding sensor domain-containing protein
MEMATGGNNIINLEGPESDKAFNIFFQQNKLFVVGGGHPTNWFPFYNLPEVSVLNPDDTWEVFNLLNQEKMKDYRDIIAVAAHPDNSNLYAVASLRQGIFFLETGKGFTDFFDPSNSPIDTTLGNISVVSDIAYDDDGNLWVVNSQTTHPVKVYTKDKKWVSLPATLQGSTFKTGKFLIATSGYIWVSTLSDGILVYDYGETVTDISDDQFKFLNFSPGSGNLPDNQVNALAEDKNGQVWVGTRNGLRVFANSSNVFSSSFNDAQDVFIQQEGRTQILFENEDISAIKIDGGNRKWFGTRGSGAFLMSEDGTSEVLHFDRANSPIYSNFINSIALNDKTGEVYLATSKGLMAYRGNAPESSDLSEILVFPNPVERGFEGFIGIKGLADEAVVKITDIAGNLIYETRAIGGMATWNGLDGSGNKVGPGVYLILCISKDGELSGQTKILFEK